jgi:non-ribosomal peptide synthase protein (TIGR01720 family)
MPSSIDDIRRRRESVPRDGAAFLPLRYLAADEEIRRRLAALPRAEVLFNYLGHFDSTFTGDVVIGLASEPCGPSRGARNVRSHPLEINAYVAGGSLHIDWAFHERRQSREWIVNLAAECVAAMESLVAAPLHAR